MGYSQPKVTVMNWRYAIMLFLAGLLAACEGGEDATEPAPASPKAIEEAMLVGDIEAGWALLRQMPWHGWRAGPEWLPFHCGHCRTNR